MGPRARYDVLVSEVVRRELEAGDPQAAARRLEMIEGVSRLAFNDDVVTLARGYQTELQLPAKAGNDVLHIAFAVAYAVDYLLTWNCAHIANGHAIKRPASINDRLDRQTPVIVTPEELLEE
ncbi:MAG: type II toxin-antitoxin system VapC family toxin [Phycisphaerales bacterium]|nr:type II toxin-antitoxin system VapC family toxin [Phycisphaerales bacterium]